MAIEYYLDFSNEHDPDEVLALMPEGLSHATSESSPRFERRYFVNEMLTITVLPVLDFTLKSVKEAFGFNTSSQLQFRLQSIGNILEQIDFIFRTTTRIAQEFDDDFVLLGDGEVVYVLRMNGRVSVNSDIKDWYPEALPALNLPYDERPFDKL